MRILIAAIILIATLAIILTTKPLKAAMEPEEISVRLATGLPIPGYRYARSHFRHRSDGGLFLGNARDHSITGRRRR